MRLNSWLASLYRQVAKPVRQSRSRRCQRRETAATAIIEWLEPRQLLSAGNVAVGTETRVNTYTLGNQTNPAVAMDAAGDYLTVWDGASRTGDALGFYGQRYNAAGIAQGNEFQIGSLPTGGRRVAFAMDAAGDFVVAYGAGSSGENNYGIYAQRFSPAGVKQGSPIQVELLSPEIIGGTDLGSNIALAMDSAGDFVVNFALYSPLQNGIFVAAAHTQRYTADGNLWGDEVVWDSTSNAITHDFGIAFEPVSVAMDAAGDYVAAITDNYGEIATELCSAAGVPQSGPAVAATVPPTVMMDAAGDFALFWNDTRSTIQGQRYNALGIALGDQFQVNTNTTTDVVPFSAAIDAAGDFVVVWEANGISAQSFNSNGTTLGSPFHVNTSTTGAQGLPAVALDSKGDVVVVWQSNQQAGAGYDIYSQRYLLQPAAMNHAPIGMSGTVGAVVNTAYAFKTLDFGFTDPHDSPNNHFQAVEITSLPTSGTLKDNGIAVTVNQFVSAADITAGKLVFTSAAISTSSIPLSFQVQDDGGTANGGVNLDLTSRVLGINVTPLNHAPAGTSGTVAALINTAHRLKVSDFGFTDPNDSPANTLLAVKITTLPNSGILTDHGTVVTAGQFVSATDISGGMLVFTPTANLGGGPYFLCHFEVEDNGGTAGGGMNLDPTQRMLYATLTHGQTITVDSLIDTTVTGHTTLRDAITTANNAPAGGDTIVFASNVRGMITLTQGELKITNAVTITGPGSGLLTISANNASRIFDIASPSSFYSVAISNLTLSRGNALANAFHTGMGGAIDNEQTLVLSNDVISFNSAASNATLHGMGGGVYNGGTMTSTNVTYSNNTSTFGGGIDNVGTLTSTNDTFSGNTAANAQNGNAGSGGAILNTYVPNAVSTSILKISHDTFLANVASDATVYNDFGIVTSSYDQFLNNTGDGFDNIGSMTTSNDTFSGNSGGGVKNDGALISLNDTISGNLSGGVNNSGTWNSTNDTIANNQLFGITNNGSLTTTFDTIAGNIGYGVSNETLLDPTVAIWTSLDTIVLGNISALGSTTATDVLYLTGVLNISSSLIGDAGDSGVKNGVNGNIVGKAVNAVFVTDVNGRPLLNDNGGPNPTVALRYGGPATGVASPLTTPVAAIAQSTAATMIAVASSANIAAGDLLRIDNEIVLVTSVVDGTDIVVQRAQNGTAAAAHSSTAKILLAYDEAGVSRTSNDIGAISAFKHSFGTTKTVTTATNVPYPIKIADIGFADPGDNPPSTLKAVKVTTLPTVGILKDNGVAVTLNQIISAADISAGKLVFTANATGSLGTFVLGKFAVQDNGGTANGRLDLEPVFQTLNVTLTIPANVNHAPTGTAGTVIAVENSTYTLQTTDFGFKDAGNTPPNSLLGVVFVIVPTTGTLADNGIAVGLGQFVSASDINGGKLTFKPNTNLLGGPFFLCKFQVEDNGGTSYGGVNLDPTAKILSATIILPNHAPVGTSTTVTTLENVAYAVKTTDFGFKDPNDTPPNKLLAVKFTALPTAGTWTDNGTAVTAGQFVSVTDISAGKLVFKPTANLSGGPYFLGQFQVEDNGGTAGGGVNLDPTPKALYVKITHVNQTPIGTAMTVTTTKNTPYAFQVTDTDSMSNQLIFRQCEHQLDQPAQLLF